jgi:hypothetical protein
MARRIAVIAIHGVGDHQPFATAKEIGDLLSDLEYQPSKTPRYAPFTEVVQRVNVRPVKTGPLFDSGRPMQAMAEARYAGAEAPCELDYLYTESQLALYKGEWPEDTYELLRLEGRRIPPVNAPNEPAPKVEPDEAGGIDQTLRKEGGSMPQDETRRREGTGSPTAAPGTQEKVVHVYEMYWADLSRLSNAFTQIFAELYQLLFQLADVGINNVKAAAMQFQKAPGAKQWQSFDKWQSAGAGILAWPAPILNLFMMAMVPPIILVSLMRRHFNPAQEFLTLVALLGLLAAVLWGWQLLRSGQVRNSRGSLARFVIPPISIALVLGLAGLAALTGWIPGQETSEAACAAIVAFLGLGGVVLIVRAYDKRQPGSLKKMWQIFAVLAGVIVVVWALGGLSFIDAPRYKAIVACINGIEIGFWLLFASWICFYVTYLITHYQGWRAVRAVKPGKGPTSPEAELAYDRSRRTRWTARLLLGLPATGFAILILIAWAAIAHLGVSFLPGDEQYQAAVKLSPNDDCPPAPTPAWQACEPGCVRYQPVVWMPRFHGSQTWCPAEHWVYKNILNAGGIVLLPIFLGAMLLALLIAMWGLAPVVWAEIDPPSHTDKDLSAESTSLGHWLTQGFTFMHVAGAIVYFIMFVPLALLLWTALTVLTSYFHLPPVPTDVAVTIARVSGALVVGAAVGILGFSGRLQSLALGFRPAVRVMLDVDNWLREYPRDSNPTARICGRYVSVLRHIVAWREDPADAETGYQALVIIAHSQGTVITADLLRYLQAKKQAADKNGQVYDPELGDLGSKNFPIYLFTMGCPLRQLYGLRFPYLYGWARGTPKSASAYTPQDIEKDAKPDPSTLGIAQWVNAFRSGDYVGRNLWRADDSSYRWNQLGKSDDWDPPAGKPDMISSDPDHTRIEFCIGPGAHTHYWDHTAALIAQTLDRLINAA